MLSILHSVKNMAFPYNSGLKTQAWDLGKGKEWWLIPLLSHSCILSSWVFSSSVCRCSGALLPDTCWPPFPLLWLLFKCQVLLWDTFKKILYFRGEESRWRRNRTERSLSLLQIHRKNNRTVKKVYKTTSDG